MDIPRETLILMYERMLKVRHFEDRVKDLFAAGEMLHLIQRFGKRIIQLRNGRVAHDSAGGVT